MRRARPDAREREHLAHGVGRLLFTERLVAGMSVAEVAALAPIDRSHLFKIEVGKARPSDVALFKIARALRPPHDREGAAALFVELVEAGGLSVYVSQSWRPRRRWRKLFEQARTARARTAAERPPAVPEGPAGPSMRRGGGSNVLGRLGGPLDATDAMREALAAARRLP